jgi:hypothetical protein
MLLDCNEVYSAPLSYLSSAIVIGPIIPGNLPQALEMRVGTGTAASIHLRAGALPVNVENMGAVT